MLSKFPINLADYFQFQAPVAVSTGCSTATLTLSQCISIPRFDRVIRTRSNLHTTKCAQRYAPQEHGSAQSTTRYNSTILRPYTCILANNSHLSSSKPRTIRQNLNDVQTRTLYAAYHDMYSMRNNTSELPRRESGCEATTP